MLKSIALMGLTICPALLSGCWPQRIVPQRSLAREPLEPGAVDPDWELLLAQTVDAKGMVNFGLADRQHRQRLERTLARFSVAGPASSAEAYLLPEARAAYWINAYNALAYRAALGNWPTPSVHRGVLSFQHAYVFLVDGQWLDLAEIRQRVDQATSGDPRARLCLCEMALGGPPMIKQPIRPATLDRQLNEQAQRAIHWPGVVQLDHEQKQLQVWRGLYRDRHRFVGYYERQHCTRQASLLNLLLELAEPQRRWELNDAVGYQVTELPFDDRLNETHPAGAR